MTKDMSLAATLLFAFALLSVGVSAFGTEINPLSYLGDTLSKGPGKLKLQTPLTKSVVRLEEGFNLKLVSTKPRKNPVANFEIYLYICRKDRFSDSRDANCKLLKEKLRAKNSDVEINLEEKLGLKLTTASKWFKYPTYHLKAEYKVDGHPGTSVAYSPGTMMGFYVGANPTNMTYCEKFLQKCGTQFCNKKVTVRNQCHNSGGTICSCYKFLDCPYYQSQCETACGMHGMKLFECDPKAASRPKCECYDQPQAPKPNEDCYAQHAKCVMQCGHNQKAMTICNWDQPALATCLSLSPDISPEDLVIHCKTMIGHNRYFNVTTAMQGLCMFGINREPAYKVYLASLPPPKPKKHRVYGFFRGLENGATSQFSMSVSSIHMAIVVAVTAIFFL